MPTGSQHGVPTGAPSGPSSTTAGGRWSGPLSTGPTGSSRLRRAGATDDIPPVPRVDPSSALLRDPQVPERDRYCRHGGKPARRSGAAATGRPGLVRGYCPQDGTPYSFAPPLSEGALVAGQYEVRGALAHGGLGWIYLAVDRNVDDRWVVLKGVLDANDPAALAAARAERQFLAQLNHPNIVAIHNFVRHVDADGVAADYIVMAYIGGSTLSQVRDARAGDGALPVAHALAYMIKVLPALGYLHAEGHVYSDFKPDNVMQCERHLTLIDMGAVARIDDADAVVYGTVGYHAPEVGPRGAVARLGPVHGGPHPGGAGAGHRGRAGRGRDQLPGDHPLLLRHESLHRLLLRATHPDPRYRFGSADEMAEQLDGVRREVLAVDEQRPRPGQSAVFSAPRGTFAASLLIGRTGPERPVAARVADLLPDSAGRRGRRSGRLEPRLVRRGRRTGDRRPRHRPCRLRRPVLDLPRRARTEARARRRRRVRRRRRGGTALLRAGRDRRPELGRRRFRARPYPLACRAADCRRGRPARRADELQRLHRRATRGRRGDPAPPRHRRCRRRRAPRGRERSWSGSTWTR